VNLIAVATAVGFILSIFAVPGVRESYATNEARKNAFDAGDMFVEAGGGSEDV
jgi:hypothetical protein